MSPSESHDRLLELALKVSDGSPVDWQGALAESPELRDTLLGLEKLASVTAVSADVADPAPEPTMLFAWGPLRVLRRLGQGSFGEVFAAWDPALRRETALKLRREEAGSAGSLTWLTEARHLARIRHPNVLTVFGADVQDGRAGIWTELLEGRTLEDTLASAGPFGAREAALIGLDLCAALAAVHGAGLVHGDIKPANVMRVGAASGDPAASGRIVLMDFGAAHDGGGTMLGTPLAAAPELLAGGPASVRSDLYALGALLYRLVSGRYPVEARTAEELRARHAAGERQRLRDVRPDLPRAFVDVVERALDPDPSCRFAGAAEMEQALGAIVAPAATGARASRRRAPRVWVAVALVLAAIAVVALARWTGSRSPAPPVPVGSVPPVHEAVSPGGLSHVGAAQASTPEVEASLLLVGEGTRQRLSDGDPIAPGDRMALEISVDPASYVYVLDCDEQGRIHLLFPLPGGAVGNPLAAGGRHLLPGRDAAGTLSWQVTSSGGEEQFLIAAATAPVPELEEALRSFSPAREGETVRYPSLAPQAVGPLRGVGGLAHAPTAGPPHSPLADLAARLGASGRDVWYRLITLENP